MVGPGTYDAKYDLIKKKANTPIIKLEGVGLVGGKNMNDIRLKIQQPNNPEMAISNVSLKHLYAG